MDRIEKSNPGLWAKLTEDGPLTLGWFEDLILEVGTTWHASGSWEFARDTCDIRVPRSLVPHFRRGVSDVMDAMTFVAQRIAKAKADAAVKEATSGRNPDTRP